MTSHLLVKGDFDSHPEAGEFLKKFCRDCFLGGSYAFLDCLSVDQAQEVVNSGIEFQGEFLEISPMQCPEPDTCHSCSISPAIPSPTLSQSHEENVLDSCSSDSSCAAESSVRIFKLKPIKLGTDTHALSQGGGSPCCITQTNSQHIFEL